MTWRNVKLVFGREIRDQLRDRRTVFMVAVLPVLLYPLLGLSFFQIAQFMRDKPSRILVVGARELGEPPLFENGRFSQDLFSEPGGARLMELDFARAEPASDGREFTREDARNAVLGGQYDAALYFPQEFADRLNAFRQAIRRGEIDGSELSAAESVPAEDGGTPHEVAGDRDAESNEVAVPSPEVIYSTATEKSNIARQRLQAVLGRWLDRVGESNLAAKNLSPRAVKPFQVEDADVAAQTGFQGAALWSKILPVLLVVWTLTGAFYPAVDLCAGEKERGTLETLLSSPAERTEIVLGKLGAIMLFSMVTAVLNLISMAITGMFAFAHLAQFSRPPLAAVLWLGLALPPAAAVFSSLALAIAAFARSTKEGQYYLMPLLFVILPLVGLPVARSLELNLGNSLIPVTGLVLLLKNLIEGSYRETLPYVFPVAAVTLAGCYFSVRWAVGQFNSESALFREGERFELGAWLRWVFTPREATPSLAAAVACGILILIVRFFLGGALEGLLARLDFAQLAMLTQLLAVALPALAMTFFLSRSPRQTLLLRMPRWWMIPGAVLLAVLLYPGVLTLQHVVMQLYPLAPELQEYLELLLQSDSSPWKLALAIVVVAPVCEELAFRGFILSGCRKMQSQWHAILLTSLFFAATHSILQQSIVAFFVGLVIAWVAVKTGSIFPAIAYHAVHNGLGLVWAQATPQWFRAHTWAESFVLVGNETVLIRWPVVMASCATAILLLYGFRAAARSSPRRAWQTV